MHFSKTLLMACALTASITQAVELISDHDQFASKQSLAQVALEAESDNSAESSDQIDTLLSEIDQLKAEIQGLKDEDASLRRHDSQQDNEIEDLLTDQLYGPEATLKRLPLWGGDEWDFEWPTPEVFAQMRPDARVSSIIFKSDDYKKYLTSVKVNYFNAASSPTFALENYTHSNGQVIAVHEAQLRAVSGMVSYYQGEPIVSAPIKFWDNNNVVS